MFMIAVSPAASGYVHGQDFSTLYATIIGPLFLTVLLMFISGLTLQERPTAKRRYEKGSNYEAYTEWLDRTSIIIPLPPALYKRMPTILKRSLFLDFPIYRFDPAKHAEQPHTNGNTNGSSTDLTNDRGHHDEEAQS
jgi:hypothetical protein